jgi:hypothetical protein
MQIPNITQSTGLLTENGIEQIQEVARMGIMVDEDNGHRQNTKALANNNLNSSLEINDASVISDKKRKTHLYESSRRLLEEGEKNVYLALELDKTQNLLGDLRSENDDLRKLLLEGINGGIYDTHNYENIALSHLLRIRIQEFGEVGASCSFSYHAFGKCKKVNRGQSDLHSIRSSPGLRKSEKEGRAVTQISEDCDCERLKRDLHKMGDRSRRDREAKHRLKTSIDDEKCKVNALSEHIENLLLHLKQAVITKAKALSERSKFQKEIEMQTQHNAIMEKRNSRKDQAINDLKEGGKVMEDQLTLMDEKYMALRMKLDWSKTQMEKVVRKKDAELKELSLQSLIAEKTNKHLFKKQHCGNGNRTGLTSKILKQKSSLLSVRTKLPSTSDGVT